MSLEEKEERIREIGKPWSSLMKSFRNVRDRYIARLQSENVADDIKDAWREYHEEHYEELLDKMAELASRKSGAA